MSLRTAEIKDIIHSMKTDQRFKKGEFLGKGGFGKCYEFIDMENGKKYAGKVVSKSLLTKEHHKIKMASEIAIHKTIEHPHIVKFVTNFENERNVYIVLELCSKKSLFELQKRRRYLTEPEVRYFMHQVVSGCKHLHDVKIIHRDLKLANIFLDENLNVKIGDFGLATQIEHDGERKRTLCGTPNYIAPEILRKIGHSFNVDAWSLGCILFTLLVGKPPFETDSLHETYRRIKDNSFSIPSRVSENAKSLICKLLSPIPESRPSMAAVLQDPFFTCGYLPQKLPLSCLVTVPHFSEDKLLLDRKPFSEVHNQEVSGKVKSLPSDDRRDKLQKKINGILKDLEKARHTDPVPTSQKFLAGKFSCFRDQIVEENLNDLNRIVKSFLTCKPTSVADKRQDEVLAPSDDPVYWISKWVDYSDKYGFGYQLTDGSHGVFFNDSSRFVLARDRTHIQYLSADGKEEFTNVHKAENDTSLTKKLAIVNHFVKYMDEKLVQAGVSIPDELDSTRLPYIHSWLRTDKAICMHLNNGIVQVNFFQDHKKLIICPRMQAVSFIKRKNRLKTYKFFDLKEVGCSSELYERIQYSLGLIDTLICHLAS